MILKFNTSNIFNWMLKLLGAQPKYLFLEMATMAMSGCGGGGGTGVDPDLLRAEAQDSISIIEGQIQQATAFGQSEQRFVDQIQAIDESMVHSGASKDVDDMTDLAIQTDVASDFAGSGEIANIKEDSISEIYDTVTDQYQTIGISADRERSNIQNTTQAAISALQNQIQQIQTQFVGATGEAWDNDPFAANANSFLEGEELVRYNHENSSTNSNPFSMSPADNDALSQVMQSYQTGSGMAMANHYANPMVTAGLYDDNELLSTVYGSSQNPNGGIVNMHPGGTVSFGGGVADFSYAGPLSGGQIMDLNAIGGGGATLPPWLQSLTGYEGQIGGLGYALNNDLNFMPGAGGYGIWQGTQGGNSPYSMYNQAWQSATNSGTYSPSNYYGDYSDRRLKHNIKLVDKSPNGHNIYEFEYINNHRYGPCIYRGVMSDEVSFAVIAQDKDGYDLVNYNHPELDVEFERIDDE